MLESLLALYPLDGPGAAELSDDERTNLRLAERELEMLRAELNKRAEELPQLQKRLAAAKALEVTQPEQAAAMYAALVNLYGGQAWAGEVVEAARERLRVLAER
jgi:hypothetical protein